MTLVGVGIDVVDIARVERLVRRKGEHALRKLLTEAERSRLSERADAIPHLAGRIAAKEAVYKALQTLPGARAIGWHDIEVVADGEGRPSIALGEGARRINAGAGALRIHLSITHSDTTAAAFAVVESD